MGYWRILSSVQRSSGPRHLVDLPEDYSTLINAAADFKCANNVVGECKNPVMCLSCGIILCSMVSIDLSDLNPGMKMSLQLQSFTKRHLPLFAFAFTGTPHKEVKCFWRVKDGF